MGQGTLRIVVPLFGPSVYPLTGILWRCHRRAALPEDATWGSWSWVCICLCASGSWHGGHRPSLGMMPPQMGATGRPRAFALVAVPLLCPHSPKLTLKRLNPAAQLCLLNSRAGRHCLHILGTDHSVPQLTCPQLLVPVVLLPYVCWTPPLCGDCGQSPPVGCGTRDVSFSLAQWLHQGFARNITGSHQPQQGTFLPTAVSTKLRAVLAAGTPQIRCVGSMRALCGHTVRPSPRHGGQAGGRGHPPQLRAASRGLGKACVSL